MYLQGKFFMRGHSFGFTVNGKVVIKEISIMTKYTFYNILQDIINKSALTLHYME